MPAGEALDCAWLLPDPGSSAALENVRIVISSGRVQAVTPLLQAPAGPRLLALPALSNAHDHARTVRSATLGAFGQPLESWLPFFSGILPGVDPYLCAVTSLARSARQGATHVMVHYTRVQGIGSYLEEAQAVARAARDVGVRIGFAVGMRDRHGIAYGADEQVLAALRPGIRAAVAGRLSVRPVSPAQQLAVVDEVASMVSADEGGTLAQHMTVQYGPTGVQWCGTPLLEAIARASADTGRPVHMHLLETRYQRDWADRAHPEGIVRFLDDIGLLSERLTLAHCTWARPCELALLAERGVTIAVNTSSNLGLKSGVAPVAEMLRQGCRVAMGLDGMALDEDDDALREMRLGYLLHRGWGYDVDMTRAQLWAFAAHHGRRSVNGAGPAGAPSAHIVAGAPADLLVLDWEALDNHSLFGGVDPLDLLLARANGSHVAQVWASGRCIVRDGRLLTLDETALRMELHAQLRAALGAHDGADSWRSTLKALAEDLGPFYRRGIHLAGCC